MRVIYQQSMLVFLVQAVLLEGSFAKSIEPNSRYKDLYNKKSSVLFQVVQLENRPLAL